MLSQVWELERDVRLAQYNRAKFAALSCIHASVFGFNSSMWMEELRWVARGSQFLDLDVLFDVLIGLLDEFRNGGTRTAAAQLASDSMQTDARGHRLIAGILRACEATENHPERVRLEMLANVGWNQLYWEYIRLCSVLITIFNGKSVLSTWLAESNIVWEIYALPTILGHLRSEFQRPSLGTRDHAGGIGMEVGSIVDEILDAAPTRRQAHVLLLASLRDDLSHLRYDFPEAYRHIMKRYKTANYETSLGLRAEARTFVDLSSRNLQVDPIPEKSGVATPDLHSTDFECNIECTSCRASGEDNVFRTFERTLRRKSVKAYAGRDLVLTVDITELFWVRAHHDHVFDVSRFRAIIHPYLEDHSFGSVILQYTVLDNFQPRRFCIRCDADDIASNVKRFVELGWPRHEGALRGKVIIPVRP